MYLSSALEIVTECPTLGRTYHPMRRWNSVLVERMTMVSQKAWIHSLRHSGEAYAGLDPVAGIRNAPAFNNFRTPFFDGVTTSCNITKYVEQRSKA